MKKLKKIICLVASLTLCFGIAASFAACGGDNANSNGGNTTEGSDNTGDNGNGGTGDNGNSADTSVTVTDQAGRTVTIASDPQNIVSGYYISTSMLIALGEKENIKGIESKGQGYRNIYSYVNMDTTTLGGYGTKKAFDTEKALTVNCDLAVIPYTLKDKADDYSASLNAPVIVVNPESDTLMREALTILGQATRNEDRAKQLTDYIDNSITEMKGKISTTTMPKVYFVAIGGILKTAGSDVYQNTLITNANATNVASSLKGTKEDTFATTDYEQITEWDPEVIIIAAEASVTVEDVKTDANIAGVSAVTNGKVYKIPDTYEAWDSPVPAAFLGSLWIAAQCYEGYTTADYEAKLADYYSTFYGITATANS